MSTILHKYYYPVLVAFMICGLLWYLHTSVVVNRERSYVDNLVTALEEKDAELFAVYAEDNQELSVMYTLARPVCSSSERDQFDNALRLLDTELTVAAGQLLLRDFHRCGRYRANQYLWRGIMMEKYLQSYDAVLAILTATQPQAAEPWRDRRNQWAKLLDMLHEHNRLQVALDDVQLTLVELRVAGQPVSAAEVQTAVAEIAPIRDAIAVTSEQLNVHYQVLREL